MPFYSMERRTLRTIGRMPMAARAAGLKRSNATSSFCTPTALSYFVAGCFFVSGVAGLIYEVLWVRLIDKVIGSAPFAVDTVLAVIMAGFPAVRWCCPFALRQPSLCTDWFTIPC
jgi:hypothetical protein